MIKIGLVLYPGCIPSGLFAFSDLLEAANQLAGERFFRITWVADKSELDEGVCSGISTKRPGIKLLPEKAIDEAELDAILLPGMWIQSISDLERILEQNERLIASLTKLNKTTVFHSYCTSVSFLAKIGRLNKLKATSTWWLANFYLQNFDSVDWDFSKTFVEGENYTCASGVNGYLPIAMHLVEKHLGTKLLRNVTKIMLLPRPESVQQPFQKVDLMALNDPLMRNIHNWVEQHPAQDLSTTALSKDMHLSERTLARKVKLATGESTMSFMRLIKLNQASEALILTNDPVGVISDATGYQDDRTFRRIFKRITGYTPGEYRETFKRPTFKS